MGRVTDTRERLLKTTLSLIRRDGYGAVTVDSICEKAGVRKGSFYYFFASKEELVVAALEWHWEWIKGQLDPIFSPTRPALERLTGYFDFVYRRQQELREELGCVVGCPLTSVGSEVSAHNPAIVKKVQEIAGHYIKYLESALRDLHAEGLLRGTDYAAKARTLYSYYIGVLAQARIYNDLAMTKDIASGAFRLIGLKTGPPVTSIPRPASPSAAARAATG